MPSKRLDEIRSKLKPYQESKHLRDILDEIRAKHESSDDSDSFESTLNSKDLFELMRRETSSQRMYKLARLYIILVEEEHGI